MQDPGSAPPTLPSALLKRPKSILRSAMDLAFAPLRFGFLSDRTVETLGLTSLRAERIAAVLPEIGGRCLDIGANDNQLIRLYRAQAHARGEDERSQSSVGVDVERWGAPEVILVESAASLPFEDESFDTVTVVATLNY